MVINEPKCESKSPMTLDKSTDKSTARSAFHAKAKQRMKWGRQLVIGGFVVAVAGIIFYCILCFSADLNPGFNLVLHNYNSWLLTSLGVIGSGTLLWLRGSFLYLLGAMESDPDDPDLYF